MLGLHPLLSKASVSTDVPDVSNVTLIPAGAKPQRPAIRVGLQIKNIYDLSLANQTFMADGWYWLAWGDAIQTQLDRLGLKPSEITEFTNEIDPSNYAFTQVLNEPLKLAPELNHSYQVKFSKKFFLNEIAQKRAPFDNQRLPIDIEIMPAALGSGNKNGPTELLPFPIWQYPIAGEFASMIGFKLTKTDWSRQLIYYEDPDNTYYSRASAIFTFSPETWTVFLKWLLPLAVVMAIVILTPSVNVLLGDGRIAIPPAALLTLVILHGEYRANFPPAPYLTFLDKIYAYSYIACFAIFVITLAGGNALSRLQSKDKEEQVAYVSRLDRAAQAVIIAGYIVVSITAWHF